VLVPSLLLGGAFLATAVWVDGPAAENRTLALVLGGVLMGAGLLAQLLPAPTPDAASRRDASTPPPAAEDRGSGKP
jgi:hypothetical protein